MPRYMACALCGVRIAVNKSSRPEPTCRPCRWQQYRETRDAQPHVASQSSYNLGCRCSECREANTVACRSRRGITVNLIRPCVICGVPFSAGDRYHAELFCSQACRRMKRHEYDHMRRALMRGATAERVVPFDIYERDGWRCHICRRKIPRDKAWPHPRSPSIDHLIPLTRGGSHEPSNVKAACLRCNVSKGNRGGNEQLLLIG